METVKKQENKAPVQRKKVYLEALRILAILFILFQHQPACMLFIETQGPLWWLYASLSVFTRMNVPMFFMISGILLLGRQEDLKTLFRKRILRHTLVILIFSAIYYVLYRVKGGSSGMGLGRSVWEFICLAAANEVEGSRELWFLYAYLGFLFMLPFLRRIAAGAEKKDLWYLMALRFVLYSLLPTLNLLLQCAGMQQLSLSEDFILPFVMFDAFFFPLFGYLLDRQFIVSAFTKKQILLLLGVLLFSILNPVIFTYIQGQRFGEYTQNFIQKYDYLLAGALFLLFKFLFTEGAFSRREGIQKAVLFLGPLAFGIYLFDHLLKEVLWAPYYLKVEPLVPTLLMSAGWIVISFIICGAFTYFLKKIPGIRRLI